jgi:hypothetical protein
MKTLEGEKSEKEKEKNKTLNKIVSNWKQQKEKET